MGARTIASILFYGLFAGSGLAQDTGEVDGSVVNGATRTGIPDVAVKVFTQLGVRYEATTNAQGQYTIRGLKPGEYSSSFDKAGFAPPDNTWQVFGRRLHVDGKSVAHLDAELIPYGRISGRVVDGEGKPVSGAIVTLDGSPVTRPPTATTTAEGSYSFDKLLPGSYTILAKPKVEEGTKATAGDRVEPVFTYFPSAMERKQAAAVVVRAGADVSGNEIRLRTVPVYRISGIVLDESGRPASGAIVSLRSRDAASATGASTMMGSFRTWFPLPDFGIEAANVETGADGKFEFASASDGDWMVHAEMPWGYIEETKRDIQAIGNQKISVSQKDMGDLKIRLTTNFDLPLQIELEDATAAKGRSDLMIVLAPMDGGPEIFAAPAKDGKLVLDRAYPGRYRVMVQTLRPGYYVASMDYGGRPISGPVDIVPGAQPLHFFLRKHAGVVRGMIEKGEAAMVLLVSDGAGDEPLVYGVPCAAGGSFQFDNLHPGSYAVIAFDRVEDQKLSDSAAVANLLRSAQRIDVKEDANAPLTLTINRWPE